MVLLNIIRKLSIIIVAILAIGLTRFGISYLIILMLIGFFMPIIAGNKKGAIFTGVLYATLSYILSYPSGLYLINYMPKEAIPVSVSSSSVFFNLFMGWLIPVVISTVVCGIFSIAGYAVKNIIYGKEDTTEHYFESTEEMEQIKTDSLNKKQKKRLLYLTPIQKAKDKHEKDNERYW